MKKYELDKIINNFKCVIGEGKREFEAKLTDAEINIITDVFIDIVGGLSIKGVSAIKVSNKMLLGYYPTSYGRGLRVHNIKKYFKLFDNGDETSKLPMKLVEREDGSLLISWE